MGLSMKRVVLLCLLFVLTLEEMDIASAADLGVIQHRQVVMYQLMIAMKTLKEATNRGDIRDVVTPAVQIEHLTQNLIALFPPGSSNDKSMAKAAIWSHWGDFTRIANDIKVNSEALAKAVSTGANLTVLQIGIKKVGGSCLACHEDFRQ